MITQLHVRDAILYARQICIEAREESCLSFRYEQGFERKDVAARRDSLTDIITHLDDALGLLGYKETIVVQEPVRLDNNPHSA